MFSFSGRDQSVVSVEVNWINKNYKLKMEHKENPKDALLIYILMIRSTIEVTTSSLRSSRKTTSQLSRTLSLKPRTGLSPTRMPIRTLLRSSWRSYSRSATRSWHRSTTFKTKDRSHWVSTKAKRAPHLHQILPHKLSLRNHSKWEVRAIIRLSCKK